jgi:hypothetical protein
MFTIENFTTTYAFPRGTCVGRSFKFDTFEDALKMFNKLWSECPQLSLPRDAPCYIVKNTEYKSVRVDYDPNAPKSAMSAYLRWVCENRSQIKESLGKGLLLVLEKSKGPHLSGGRLFLHGETKMAALTQTQIMWKLLSDDEKEPFEVAFKADQVRYKAEMTEYNINFVEPTEVWRKTSSFWTYSKSYGLNPQIIAEYDKENPLDDTNPLVTKGGVAYGLWYSIPNQIRGNLISLMSNDGGTNVAHTPPQRAAPKTFKQAFAIACFRATAEQKKERYKEAQQLNKYLSGTKCTPLSELTWTPQQACAKRCWLKRFHNDKFLEYIKSLNGGTYTSDW